MYLRNQVGGAFQGCDAHGWKPISAPLLAFWVWAKMVPSLRRGELRGRLQLQHFLDASSAAIAA